MLKKLSLTIMLLLFLSGCSSNNTANTNNKNMIKEEENFVDEMENNESKEDLVIDDEDIDKQEKIEKSNKDITQEDAEKIFYSRYEGFNIDILKRQGQVYYIQGKNIEGNKIQKVKINVKDGEIVFEKLINKGGY